VLREIAKGHPLTQVSSGAEESTLRRWRQEFQGKIQSWAGQLEAKAQELLGVQTSLLNMSSQPLKRLEQALLRLPDLPFHWVTLVKALQWVHPTHFT
jgi:hypothetical protein